MHSDLSIQYSAEKLLPDDYKRILIGFAIVELLLKIFPSNDLRVKLASSPPLQQYYDTVLAEEGYLAFELRNMAEIPLVLSLINDLLDRKKAYTVGAPKIIDEVERLMQSDASRHALITGPIAKEISEIAAFAETEMHMHHHRPRITLPVNRDTSAKLAERRIERITTIRKALEGARISQYAKRINLIHCSSYGTPYGTSYEKLTENTTPKMPFMETGLDHFWWRIDECLEKQCGTTLHGLMRKSASARKIQRTPQWQTLAYSKSAGPTSAPFQKSTVKVGSFPRCVTP
ncbi:hypothetical protein MMC28_003293 [Mycoblastus sanguinarius]|nr:hypothetical protein [Mycoblastus sanguinarius]